MQTQPARRKLTLDDYNRSPDDGLRHEILDGVEFVSPSPRIRHQDIAGELYYQLRSFLAQSPVGKVYIAPTDVILSHFDVVVPDFVFVTAERTTLINEKNIAGAPDLIIEILSPSSRRVDEEIKRQRYAHFGVREYWIVDPKAEHLRCYRRGSGGVAAPEQLSGEAVLETPLLPGFRLALATLFPH